MKAWRALVAVGLAGALAVLGFLALMGAGLPPGLAPPTSGTGQATLPYGCASRAEPPCSPAAPAPGVPRHALGDPRTSGLADWPAQFDAPPKAFDLDGDGADELVALANDTFVYVFSTGGRVVARLPTTTPADWYVERVLNQAEAAVLRPGEPPSLVITSHAAYVTVWQVVPGLSRPGHVEFRLMWEQRMDGCFGWPGMDAKPTLADLDGDGALEILVQTEEVGFFALRADGTELWRQCWAGGNASPVAADLDHDGRLEVVVASDNGLLAVLDGASGSPLWTFDASRYVKPASISVEPTVADLDGQGESEVLFTVRDAPDADPTTWPQAHMAIFAVHRDPATWQPELVWMRQPEWANPLSYTRLAVLDADQDGRMDIFGMDWNTVGHEPGNWERLGPAHAFRLDAQGNDVWVRTLDTWWSNKDIAIADTDADGRLEVVVDAPGPSGHDSLTSLDVGTGGTVRSLELPGWQLLRGPAMVDLLNDGRMQVVAAVSPTEGDATRGALLILDLDVPYNAPWRGTP
jgi:hypothetical protein